MTSLFKTFITYITFNILGQMAYSFYTVADTFFVAYAVRTDGLTALNLAFPIFCIISGLGLMIGIGASTHFSILKSKGDKEALNQVYTNACLMVTLLSIIFILIALFGSKPLTYLLGARGQVFNITHIYLKTILCFAPAFILNHLIQCFVRNDGAPALSMAAMMIGSFANIILDYIFIFPLKMGIFGAAFATGLSPLISLCVLSPHFIFKKNSFHLTPLKQNYITKIISNGIPPFLNEAASGIVMFLFNAIILNISGNIGVAAFSVISAISLVVVALYTGLSQGMQPLISKHYGSNELHHVKTLLKYSMIASLLLSLGIYLCIYINAPTLVAIFNHDHLTSLSTLAITGLKVYFMACPFIGLNIVYGTYYISMNQPKPAQSISIMRSLLILVPMALVLSSCFDMMGVWLAYPLSEATVYLISCIKKDKW